MSNGGFSDGDSDSESSPAPPLPPSTTTTRKRKNEWSPRRDTVRSVTVSKIFRAAKFVDNDAARVLLAKKALEFVPWDYDESGFRNKYGDTIEMAINNRRNEVSSSIGSFVRGK
jgi:hypothetical protein